MSGIDTDRLLAGVLEPSVSGFDPGEVAGDPEAAAERARELLDGVHGNPAGTNEEWRVVSEEDWERVQRAEILLTYGLEAEEGSA